MKWLKRQMRNAGLHIECAVTAVAYITFFPVIMVMILANPDFALKVQSHLEDLIGRIKAAIERDEQENRK